MKEHTAAMRFLYVAASGFMMVFAALLCSGCESTSQSDMNMPLPLVHYSVVQGEALTVKTELPGRVSAFVVSEVRPQVSGIIKQRLFEEGADVKAGQVLYRIDDSLFRAAYNNARAGLARAEAQEVSSRKLSSRYAKLAKTHAVSQQDADDALAAHKQALADVRAAREAVETARINLGYTAVTAPVSGRIGRSYVTPGALVTQNQMEPLATIQHLDSVYVDVTQSNTEVLRLRRALAEGRLAATDGTAKVKLKLEDGSDYVRLANAATAGGAGSHNPLPADISPLDKDAAPGGAVVATRGARSADAKAALSSPAGSLGVVTIHRSEGGLSEDGGAAASAFVPEVIEGELLFSEVSVDKSTGAVALRARFENPDGLLLPGMYVRAVVEEGERKDALLVPQKSVMRDTKGRPYVYLLREDDAANEGGETFAVEMRKIELGRNFGNRWHVTEGLAPGEKVLVEGVQKARPGRLVCGEDVNGETLRAALSNEREVRKEQ